MYFSPKFLTFQVYLRKPLVPLPKVTLQLPLYKKYLHLEKNEINKRKYLQLDDFDLCAIRNKIHSMYTVSKEVPTLSKLLAELKVDINFSGEIGFRFKNVALKETYGTT